MRSQNAPPRSRRVSHIYYIIMCRFNAPWLIVRVTFLAPFIHVPQHVEQAQIVGQQAPAGPGMFLLLAAYQA